MIGGPGAFMVAAERFEDFADAILKKMIIEIAMNAQPKSTARRQTADAGFAEGAQLKK